MNNKISGNVWSEIRELASVSVKAVCEFSGISRQFLFAIEKGKSNPSEQTMQKLKGIYLMHLEAQKKIYKSRLDSIEKHIKFLEEI